MATDAPPADAWDRRQSRIWVNSTLIKSPLWKYSGQKGDLERPLADEGYEYRTSTPIFFKKGWNSVLVKLPVGSFRGKNNQNPVKWMLTFTPCEEQDFHQ